jgi:hypothetical protein
LTNGVIIGIVYPAFGEGAIVDCPLTKELFVRDILLKPVRYGLLPAAAAGVFLLFSCAFFEDIPVPDPVSDPPLIDTLPGTVKMISVDSSGKGSVTLDGLSDKNVYLVRVNTSGLSVSSRAGGTVPAAGADGLRVPAGTVTIGGQTLTRYEMQWPLGIPPEDVSRSAVPVSRSAASVYATAEAGDTKTFYVNHTSPPFGQKTATLKKIGKYCKIWVVNDYFDDASSNLKDNKVTQAQIDALAGKFDLIYPVETNLLGYEYGGGPGGNGGADGDARIQILVYDIDGDYGKQRDGVVLGYFYSVDEYPDDDRDSNEAEIFYLDSEVLDGNPTVLYSTLVHEFNHMINYNVKVLDPKTGKSANYESWYTEMLSMLAEDAIGPFAGIEAGKDGHVIKERIPAWLVSFNDYGVMQWKNGADVLGYYASNYAFGAYLARNFGGPALVSAIAKSPNGGRTSLDESLRAHNSSLFSGLDVSPSEYALARFGEALVYSGTKKPNGVYSFDKSVSGTVGNTRYTFSGFDIRTMTYKTKSSTLTGPQIPRSSGASVQVKPYGIYADNVNSLKSASGRLTIGITSENANMYYFVMTE